MADEETRQMFRELLATQKEYLELLRQISETDAANRIANLLRALALIGIAAVLAYLVLFGLHRH